jgi:hypothetical protein
MREILVVIGIIIAGIGIAAGAIIAYAALMLAIFSPIILIVWLIVR